ncbi:CAP domain-containing protein [bacterium]|nr:CAP domain-containing protein [bacterium]
MSTKLLAILFCLLLLFAAELTAERIPQQEKESAYQYINQLRTRAGLIPFSRSSILEKSAANHARYLSKNNLAGHLQSRNRPEFTGEKPDDRALFAGYASRDVTENFSAGQKDAQNSIDGLMSAIYHRFAFLDLSKNELGIGIERNHQGLNFVYNMGNDRLNRFCRYGIFLNDGPFYTSVCRHQGKVSAVDFDLRKNEVWKQNPEMVVWPLDGALGIPPVFYDETPDPLPDYRVSGYPISVQMNPSFFKKVELERFKLFQQDTNTEVVPIRLLTKRLDPNQRFSAFDFALFPLNRLAWDTVYRVELMVKADGRPVGKTWTFQTAAVPSPMFMIKGRNENLQLVSDRQYAVYIAPANRYPYIERLRWESMSEMKTEVSWLDRNTILVKLNGKECESTHFFLNGDRSFIVQVADRDNLNEEQTYARGPLPGCLINTLKDLPGFRVSARGEVIPMKADQDYWVEITAIDKPVTEVKWQLLDNMQIRVNHLERNILKIRLSGFPGQIATFYLSNSRMFKVVLTK